MLSVDIGMANSSDHVSRDSSGQHLVEKMDVRVAGHSSVVPTAGTSSHGLFEGLTEAEEVSSAVNKNVVQVETTAGLVDDSEQPTSSLAANEPSPVTSEVSPKNPAGAAGSSSSVTNAKSGDLPLTQTTSPVWLEQLVETLRGANGPPTTTLGSTASQLFYLDFDGDTGAVYNGPVLIKDIRVSPFQATGELAGKESEIIVAFLAALDSRFAGLGISFTASQPEASTRYSTIYVGATSAFSAYGNYLGLSEKVDVGNQDQTDKAFILTNNIPSGRLSASEYGELLAGYVAHEMGHLLGFEHEHEVAASGTDPLAAVAYNPYTHVEVAKDVLLDLFGDPNVQGDEDNTLTINGQTYVVHPKLLAALRDYPSYYFAGVVGPDGFPDPTMGSVILHPNDAGVWLVRILDMAWQAQNDPSFTNAEKSQILAWSFGYLTHESGDHWAHTLVNEFTEGVAPGLADAFQSQRNAGNLLRHFLTEGYIADASPGFDRDPDRTVLPDGDVSDNSTPGIPYDAPIRFIYETLIKPFQYDPSPLLELKLGDKDMLSVNGTTHSFVLTTGNSNGTPTAGFVSQGFDVGHRITVTGFTNVANNGVFHVTAITATTLTVAETLAVEAPGNASGDEAIKVFIAYNDKTTLTVNSATDSFVRTAGSFKDDGFRAGQRITAYGFNGNKGDYLVKEISGDGKTLTVWEDLVAGDATGSGDEQLVQQGPRGRLLDKVLALRDKIEMLAINRGARVSFGGLVSQFIGSIVSSSVSAPSVGDLLTAYLYNWVDEINEALRNWAQVGLALTRTLFDAQSRRDVQNLLGASAGADTLGNTARAAIENSVGIIAVLIHQLDDPNHDGSKNDSFIDKHLLPMLGLPEELGFLQDGVRALFGAIGDLLSSNDVEDTTNAAATDPDATVSGYLKGVIKDWWGFDFDLFEYLTKINSKMDLVTVQIGTMVIPVFKPGDHEKLDAYMGITPAQHHAPLPAGFTRVITIPGATLTFYADAEGPLLNTAQFNRTTFAAFANSVVLSKLVLLQEDAPAGDTTPTTAHLNQLSKLFNDNIGGGSTYDASLLNLNGAHGGNILTATLPGVTGAEGRPWLVSIDADQVWRIDNYTTTTALFRISTQNKTSSPATWTTTITPGAYRIYITWQENLSQMLDNLDDPQYPDQPIRPATNAQYTVKDASTPFLTQPDPVDQRRYAGDPAYVSVQDGNLAFRSLGLYTFTTNTLRLELSNLADGHVVAGPVLIEQISTGIKRRVQFNRNPNTLVPTGPLEYTDAAASWTNLVYRSGTGNNPLWASATLRPVFRALFTDYANGALDYPDLGDTALADPNNGAQKNQRPGSATPFGPVIPDTRAGIIINNDLLNTILDGLNKLVAIVNLGLAPVGFQLPVIGSPIDELADLGRKIKEKVLDPVADFFRDNVAPTFSALFDIIRD
ncbi:MAG: hypothetical protein HOP33_10365, partial [Verrucomicrobia bacterium]|nr:hypothetical protein [Verrucomicrobiota bacterium]